MLEARRDLHNAARRFCVGNVPSVQDVAAVLDSISTHFVLFLALDATKVKNEVLQKIARALLDRGMVYLCAWGPDCERVHDLVDQQRAPVEPEGEIVMTSWHSKESLSEALWFFANCAEPTEGFETTCRDWVAISVANEAWEMEIREGLFEGKVEEAAPPIKPVSFFKRNFGKSSLPRP
ncbi:MAG: hypothetical protein KGM96_07775 [Acidobacteriota bacterium]|nr:hypothetical protein [Acidobacteriota bacterium]